MCWKDVSIILVFQNPIFPFEKLKSLLVGGRVAGRVWAGLSSTLLVSTKLVTSFLVCWILRRWVAWVLLEAAELACSALALLEFLLLVVAWVLRVPELFCDLREPEVFCWILWVFWVSNPELFCWTLWLFWFPGPDLFCRNLWVFWVLDPELFCWTLWVFLVPVPELVCWTLWVFWVPEVDWGIRLASNVEGIGIRTALIACSLTWLEAPKFPKKKQSYTWSYKTVGKAWNFL